MPQILQRFDTGRNDIEFSDINNVINQKIVLLRTGDNLSELSNLKLNIAQYVLDDDILDLFRNYDVKMLSRIGTGRNDIEYEDLMDFRNVFYPGFSLNGANSDGIDDIVLHIYLYQIDNDNYTGFSSSLTEYGDVTIESVDKTSFTFTENKLLYDTRTTSLFTYPWPYIYLSMSKSIDGSSKSVDKAYIFFMMALRYKYIYVGNIRYNVDYGAFNRNIRIGLTNQVGEIIPNVTTFRTIRFSNT